MINGKVRKKPLISTQTEKHLTTVLTAAARVQIKSAGSGSLGIARRVFLPRSQCAADRSVEIPPMRAEDGSAREGEAILEGSGTRLGETFGTFGCSYELLLLMPRLVKKKKITSEWK